MDYVSPEEYQKIVSDFDNRIKAKRSEKNRKARLRNGTAKCGGTLVEKLAYLKGKQA